MKNSRKKETGKVLKNVYRYFLKSAWGLHKVYFIARFFKVLITAVEPFVAILFTPLIIAELMGDREIDLLFHYVAAVVILNFVIWVLHGGLGSIVDFYAQKMENFYQLTLSEQVMGLDFVLTEDKKALDQLELAKNGMSRYSGGINGLLDPLCNIISSCLTLVGVITIIVSKAPFVLVITFVILICTTWINARLNQIEQEGYAKLSKVNRIFEYLGWKLADFHYGKDIRLYDAKDMLIEKWDKYTKNYTGQMEQIANRQLPLQLINMVTSIVQDFGTYFYLGVLAITGRITIATVTQMITAAGTFSGAVQGVIYNYQDMVKRANYANEFVKFLDYPMAMHEGTREVEKKPHVFEFDQVSFSYPGSNVKVLDGMNLTITEGQHLSIVGLNGAGKTTMIKLLSRLYDPTAGVIRMDGVDIREYDYEQYMSVFAPVFQDFKLFSFPISENLLLQESESVKEEERLLEILKKVGIYEKVESLPKGMDTVLFQYFDKDGIYPSGGEQQKLAIARALVKDAPVVVLDEPTAALDPIAEYEIYRQFQDLVQGKTAIFISHRLSSCQFCDEIAVFSDGKVKEYGTHAELVAIQNGIYAQMFEAQAQYYRG